LVVAGNLQYRKEMEKEIGELFGALPEQKTILTPSFAPIKPSVHENHFVKNTQQHHVII
jgi:hypothetical protein